MVLNAQGLVFVGRRIDLEMGEAWQMPQGGVDEGEDLAQAVRRELAEETGMTSVRIVGEVREWLTYELPREAVGVALKGKYRGQKMKWFALRFEGAESEIDLNAHEPPEFDQWRWVEIDEVVRLIVPFKRGVYEQVVRAFRPLAQGRFA